MLNIKSMPLTFNRFEKKAWSEISVEGAYPIIQVTDCIVKLTNNEKIVLKPRRFIVMAITVNTWRGWK